MQTHLNDTRPEAEHVQLQLLRQAGTARRIALAWSVSQTVFDLSRSALRRRHPLLSERERQMLFVALCYGDDLAARLRADLRRREPW